MLGELVASMFVSLDGVMQAPGEPREDLDGGFEHGGLQVPYIDQASAKVMTENLARMDALLLGGGKRVFGDGTVPTALRLVDSTTFDAGVVLLTYQRVGKLAYGDMD